MATSIAYLLVFHFEKQNAKFFFSTDRYLLIERVACSNDIPFLFLAFPVASLIGAKKIIVPLVLYWRLFDCRARMIQGAHAFVGPVRNFGLIKILRKPLRRRSFRETATTTAAAVAAEWRYSSTRFA